MTRFLAYSASAHAVLAAILIFATADLHQRQNSVPLGTFSISLDQEGKSMAFRRGRQSVSQRLEEAASSERALSEPSPVVGDVVRSAIAGSASTAGQLGSPDGVRAGLRERYLYELRLAIDREKKYPLAAKEMQQEGRVEVSFKIAVSGKFEAIQLVGLSPYERLNTAALKLVQGIAEFRPLPEEISGEPLLVKLPIDYVLK
jgi:TonB family protein